MILVAGLGNIFLGDDGFGVEVAGRLAERQLPEDVQVRDFGIRGMDLAYALMDPYDAVVLVDAARRGEPPGTLSLIEASVAKDDVVMDTHGWEPDKVMALAQSLGVTLPPVYVLACEPDVIVSGDANPDLLVDLSPAVRGAVDEAVRMVEELVAQLTSQEVASHA
jgi:hydrogenase maturation protease